MFTAVISLIILAVILFFFVTELLPSTTVALTGCLLYVLLGVCSFSDAFSGFSNSIVILVFGMLIVGDAVFETGLANKIGFAVSKLARNNELLIMLYCAIASGVLSMWLSNTAVIALFLAIIRSLCASGKYNEMNLSLPVSMGAMFGGVCTLVGSTPQLTMQSVMIEIAGVEFAMFDFMKVGLILFAVYLAYIFLVGRKLGKKIWGGRTSAESSVSDSPILAKVNLSEDAAYLSFGPKGIIMLIILLGMIVSFILGFIPVEMTAALAGLACVLTKCTNHKRVLKTMNWDVLLRLAGCLGIAKALQVGGGTELIADLFVQVCGDRISPYLLLFAGVALCMLVSNFITNSTAILIFLPIVLPIALKLGFSPYPFGMAMCYAANLTFATPLANAQTALTMVSGYKFKDYFFYNILLELLILTTIMVAVPIAFPFN